MSLNRFCFKGFVALIFAFTHGELQVAIRVLNPNGFRRRLSWKGSNKEVRGNGGK